MTGISLLTMLLKKVYAYDNDRTNCNDTCTANVIRELCHDRDTYHYSVNKDSCSEFNDFDCLLLYFVVMNFCNSICIPRV